MHKLTQLKPAHLDLLKEVGNIGAGHAASALSSLLGKRIKMTIPSVSVVPLEKMSGRQAETNVAASYIDVGGELKGCFFLMFELADANRLIGALVPGASVLDEGMGRSAFREISNILCGSYLSALADFLGITLVPSPPSDAVDMKAAILGEGLIELSLYDDAVLMIEAELIDQDQCRPITGEFLFLPIPESLDTIFSFYERKSSK
ncbi:MAG: chemotaxis protein CheC [Sporolactobacillus sp.]|jgi:chemotaxis protein CheC|nr:chemotaxis protein CheC [Sporolactobacillus sp.]MCI1883046.1 chemotaxis protein CheC [Sporolactobacillus sp.]